MKKISILIPCYNEEENIEAMKEALTEQMQAYRDKYDYELVFRDNASTDRSADVLRRIAAEDPHVKVIINARNYGMDVSKDTFFGRVTGDAILTIAADFQAPPELIPQFIYWWEQGYEVVCGQKLTSQENKGTFRLRQLFYKIIDHFSEIPQYRNMVGISLLSRRIYDIRKSSRMDAPFRYFISDLGCEVKLIPYEQQRRRAGKSSYNVRRYLSFAITSLISTSTVPLRIATVSGFFLALVSFVIGVIYLIIKLILWNRFSAGVAPLLIGVFFIGSIQLFFIGIVGEYVGNILHKVSRRPPPIVKELINIDEDDPYYVKQVERSDVQD